MSNVVELSKEDFKKFCNNSTFAGKSKYPWYDKKVGEGFFVPLYELNGDCHRPMCPPKLKEEGQRWVTHRGRHAGLGEEGIFVKRVE